jgi:hypothetical protein
METKVKELPYAKSFIQDLVLTHLKEDDNITPTRLNELYPAISIQTFSVIQKQLERKALVSSEMVKKIDKAFTINDTEVPADEVKKLIYKDLKLMPKQLNILYPNISTARFNAIRHYLPEIKVQRYKNKHSKNGRYFERDYESKQNIRNEVAKRIFASGVFGVIPVLPHFDWLGEVAINKLTDKNYYLGIADDDLVVKGATIQKDLLGINGEMVLGDMFEVLKKYPSNSFAHIGMDFCGVLPTQIDCVKYAMENNLVQVGGYIFLTVKRIVRYCTNDNMKVYNMFRAMNTPDTNLVDSDYANGKFLEASLLDNYELTDADTIKYQTGSPMVFYAIKRVK